MTVGIGHNLSGGRRRGTHRRVSAHGKSEMRRRLAVLRNFETVEHLGRGLFADLPVEVVTANDKRVIAIDVDSKRHYIADSVVAAVRNAKAAAPDARLYVARIGVGHVYRLAR